MEWLVNKRRWIYEPSISGQNYLDDSTHTVEARLGSEKLNMNLRGGFCSNRISSRAVKTTGVFVRLAKITNHLTLYDTHTLFQGHGLTVGSQGIGRGKALPLDLLAIIS